MVHGTGDHLEDAVDRAAVQPDIQRSHHQSLYGRLLDAGQHFLRTPCREVLGAYNQEQCSDITYKKKNTFLFFFNVLFTKRRQRFSHENIRKEGGSGVQQLTKSPDPLE